MLLVTAIEKGKGTGWNLFVEGEFALHVDTETLVQSGLQVGKDISPPDLDALRCRADTRRARERALYLLEQRPHTKKELRDKLAKTVDPDIACTTAERMEELGLVDDADYARRLAASLARQKGWGPGRIRQRLCEKGVPRELAAQALAELEEQMDAPQAIQAVVRKKYLRYVNDQKGVEKTIAALMRLGYRYQDIRQALCALSEDE